MKNYILIFLLIFPYLESKAQSGRFSASLEAIGGIGVVTYSNDSLVPPNRRDNSRFDDISFVNAYFSFYLKNHRFNIKTGIGKTRRDFQLNKNNLSDFFLAIFSFDSYRNDTFRIEQIKFISHYLNVPVGISYRLTKDENKSAEFRIGLQLTGSFLVGQKVALTFDQSYFTPTSQQIIDIEKEYQATERPFVLSIQPRLDIFAKVYKSMGLFFNLQPLIINLKSYNNRLYKTGAFVCLAFGTYFDF